MAMNEGVRGRKNAHPHIFCATFWHSKGLFCVLKEFTFAYKEAPREKIQLRFFHAETRFFCGVARQKRKILITG